MKFIITLPVLFLWTAIVAPLSCMSSSDCEAVVDTEGEYLRPNVPYYIMPVMGGGGMGLAAGHDKVVQLAAAAEGMPVTFRPANESDGVVCISADTEVAFSNIDTTAWTVASDGVLMMSDGLIDEAGETSGLPSWCKIKKYRKHPHHRHYYHYHKHHKHDHRHHKHRHHDRHHNKHPHLPHYPIIHRYYYKLAFCFSTIDKCGDLGIFAEEDGDRWLGLNGTAPFPVVFKRA